VNIKIIWRKILHQQFYQICNKEDLHLEGVIDQYTESIENPDEILKKYNQSLAYQVFWEVHTLFEKSNIKLITNY